MIFLYLGNDILHQLTSHVNMELKIVMSDFLNVSKNADYSTFHVADEASGYRLSVGGYTGNAGNIMITHQDASSIVRFCPFCSETQS